jgi:DDE superfamily endonuclease
VVAAMEAVRDLYEEPYDPRRPTVNFEDTSQPLLAATRAPLPAKPGQPARYDDADERHGTRHLLMLTEPPAGGRHMAVTAQRTLQDFAFPRPWLVDAPYPEAEVMRVVLDNLQTHKPASLSEACAPAEARRLLKKLEGHDTPKHGSW